MIRNLLLLGLAFSAGIDTIHAQNRRVINRNSQPVKISVNATPADNKVQVSGSKNPGATSGNKIAASAYGTQIGKTYYDLPTNRATGNRLLRHPDGTISVVWNEACSADISLAYPTRGIGYNYYSGGPVNTTPYNASLWAEGTDGTCPDPYGIASTRQGWPEIMLAGNKEVVISHSGSGISMTSRNTKGAGAWSPTLDLPFTTNINGITGNAGSWPRAVSNGNTIHMIYTIHNTPVPVINGVKSPIVYNRSDDGGTTWSKQNVALPGLTGPASGVGAIANGYDNIGADNYAMAVRGNTIAIVAGSLGDPWTLWKSTDNGNTFTRTIIDRITEADTTMTLGNDTVGFVNDGAHNVIIDHNNVVHVWNGGKAVDVKRVNTIGGGKQWVVAADTAGRFSRYPGIAQSIFYWNENITVTMSPHILSYVPNPPQWTSGIQVMPIYGTCGDVSMPNAAIDAGGNIYLVFTSIVYDTLYHNTWNHPFRDLFIMKRDAITEKWSDPVNIPVELEVFPSAAGYQTAAENFEESVYPNVVPEIASDNILHLTWLSDHEPGMHVTGEDNPADNAIMYIGLNVPAIQFVYRSTGVQNDLDFYVNSIVAYPNPTTGETKLTIDLKKPSDISVKVTNLMGQKVMALASTQMASGPNTIILDMTGLAKGVYLYSITSENFTATRRIVKQ